MEDLRGVGCTLKDRVELVHKNGVDVGELAGRGNNRGMQRWDDVVMVQRKKKSSFLRKVYVVVSLTHNSNSKLQVNYWWDIEFSGKL